MSATPKGPPKLTRNGAVITAKWEVTSTEGLGAFKLFYRTKGAPAWVEVLLGGTARECTFPAAAVVYEAKIETFDYGGGSAVATCPAPPPESIRITLTPDKTGVTVLSAPPGTTSVTFAELPSLAGVAVDYLSRPYPLTEPFVPKAGVPVVDANAVNSNREAIGGWAGRLQTIPPPSKEYLGLGAGNWGTGAVVDIGTPGVRLVRLPQGVIAEEAPRYKAAGFEVIGIFGETGSIAALAANAAGYASNVAAVAAKYDLLAVEVLNEPGGGWFWGDPTNFSGYRTLCKATYEAVLKAGIRTQVLASFDGGKGGGEGVAWGEHVHAEGTYAFCHGVTCHPYGGGSGGNGGALGDRHKCLRAIEVTGLPLWVTEAGWPTGAGSTGDSQSWTEAQQAANYASWIAFQETTPKFVCTTFYNYKNPSDSGAAQYGVEMHDSNRRKPSFGVLGEACKRLVAGTPFGHTRTVEGAHVEGTEEHTWQPGEKLTPQQLTEGHLDG